MNPNKYLAVSIAAMALSLAALSASAQTARPSTTAPAKANQAKAAEQAQAQIDATFKAWDTDKNGVLSLQEFRAGTQAMRRAVKARESLRGQFKAVDVDNNNVIDANEYGKLVLIIKAGNDAPPLSAYDKNKNQTLEFAEYVVLVREMSARKPTSTVPTGKTPAPAR